MSCRSGADRIRKVFEAGSHQGAILPGNHDAALGAHFTLDRAVHREQWLPRRAPPRCAPLPGRFACRAHRIPHVAAGPLHMALTIIRWLVRCAWLLCTAALHAQAIAGTGLRDARDAQLQDALQSCPAIEEEIVDLDLLAEGLKNSRAVGVVEKLRLRTAIDGLIGRMKAFHDGAKDFSEAELQQQYDLLLMRIAAHLQHKDQVLHGRLCNAWEPIWRDLVDSGSFHAKFK